MHQSIRPRQEKSDGGKCVGVGVRGWEEGREGTYVLGRGDKPAALWPRQAV